MKFLNLEDKNYSIWKNEKFIKTIGGLENVSKSEKIENINLIKNAISSLKKGEIITLPFMVFVKSYPESINYVKKYYKLFHQALANKKIGYEGKTYVTYKEAMDFYKDEINYRKIVTIMIYAPILSDIKSLNELKKYMNLLGISSEEFVIIVNNYKIIKSAPINSEEELGENDTKLLLGSLIAEEIINNKLSKQDIKRIYNINIIPINNYLDFLKKFDMAKYEKVNKTLYEDIAEINELISILSYYILNGINKNGEHFPFTILDYYSLTAMSPSFLYGMLNYMKCDNKEDALAKRCIIEFIFKNSHIGSIVNLENIEKQKISFTNEGNKIEITKLLSEEILTKLNEANIPSYYEIFYTALYRYSKGIDIFLFKTDLNNKTNKDNKRK